MPLGATRERMPLGATRERMPRVPRSLAVVLVGSCCLRLSSLSHGYLNRLNSERLEPAAILEAGLLGERDFLYANNSAARPRPQAASGCSGPSPPRSSSGRSSWRGRWSQTARRALRPGPRASLPEAGSNSIHGCTRCDRCWPATATATATAPEMTPEALGRRVRRATRAQVRARQLCNTLDPPPWFSFPDEPAAASAAIDREPLT